MPKNLIVVLLSVVVPVSVHVSLIRAIGDSDWRLDKLSGGNLQGQTV